MRIHKFIIAAMASTSVLSLATPALAQSSADETETVRETDIVVTAQKRVERVQDVPLSIAVSTQEDLERQQVNTIADLARIAPSLEILQSPGQNTGGGGQIRGVGTQTFNAGAVGAVGIVVDQVSQGNANISDLFDVARVEVLKGPQGTLFGLTTSAGVINITTNAPDPTSFSGRIRGEVSKEGFLGSGFGLQVVQGVVNVPVGADAALRLSGNLRFRQGTNRNALDGSLDTHSTYNMRGRFLWTPSDRLTLNAIGEYSRTKDNGNDFFTVVKADAATTAVLNACGVTPEEGNRDYCTSRFTGGRQKGFGGSLQIDYEADPFTITSVTNYRGTRTGPNFGDILRIEANPLQILAGPAFTQTDLYTQELRIASPANARLEYTAGLYVSHQKQHSDPEPFKIQITIFPGFVITPVNSLGNDTTVEDESMAVFGQVNYHLTDNLTVIAGGRYTAQRLSVFQLDTNPGGLTNRGQTSVENFSWKGGLQYEFSRDLMAYGTVARGYKGPQITFPTQGGPATIIRPELPLNYEVGVKAQMLDGKVSMDFSAFHLKLKDYQGQTCAVDPVTNGLRCFQVNLQKVISKGVELNFSARPADGLLFNIGGIYNEIKYPSGYIGGDGSNLTGKQLAYAPRFKFTTSGEYNFPVSGNVDAFVSGDAIYKSKIQTDATTDPQQTFRGHWTLGARAGIRSADKNWTIAAFVRNLGNVHEPVLLFRNFPGAGSSGAIYGTQSFRQVGLNVDFSF